MTTALEIVLWASLGSIVFTHFGYPAVLWALNALGVGFGDPIDRPRRRASRFQNASEPDPPNEVLEGPEGLPVRLPRVSLIVAAYDEEDVIAMKVANALSLDYPRELLQVIVASDGSGDATVERARGAGADLVLDLPRQGKTETQNQAAREADGEILAFSDANSIWEDVALRNLVEPFLDPSVAYVCGQVKFTGPDGGNLEGAYWAWEMKVRQLESGFAGVTAGNGAIYAVRARDYIELGPAGSHDLSFPFAFAREGFASIYRPAARAIEKMVPSLEGELARKRRMMIGLWDIVIGERMIDLRGLGPAYGFEILSHRILRYLTPFLHLALFLSNLVLVFALDAGPLYTVLLILQAAVLLAAIAGRGLPLLPFRIARYYSMTTAAIGLGLWDRWRRGRPGTWEKAEGTR